MYATVEMKYHFVFRYSHVRHPKISLLRQTYHELAHHSSAPRTSDEVEINEQVAEALLDLDDPDLIFDLHQLNSNPNSIKFGRN